MLYSIGTMLRWFYVIIRMLLHAFRVYVDHIVLFLDQNSQFKRFFSRIFAISIFFHESHYHQKLLSLLTTPFIFYSVFEWIKRSWRDLRGHSMNQYMHLFKEFIQVWSRRISYEFQLISFLTGRSISRSFFGSFRVHRPFRVPLQTVSSVVDLSCSAIFKNLQALSLQFQPKKLTLSSFDVKFMRLAFANSIQ